MKHFIFAVLGDIHHQLATAIEGLTQLEKEIGQPLDQVFTVGDLGLFLEEKDWHFLTGPKKYKEPEISPTLRKLWDAWRWPLSMIGGNHEPYHLLRDWKPEAFGNKLDYTDVGWLTHSMPGLRVAGLSGIFHPEHLDFSSSQDQKIRHAPKPKNWADMVGFAASGTIATKRLTYYKETEIARMKTLRPTPHLLLLHDWPVLPQTANEVHTRRPEREIVEALSPPFVCCGHHHHPADFELGSSRILALNLICHAKDCYRGISLGWVAVFSWTGEELHFLKTWPAPETQIAPFSSTYTTL